MPETAQPIRIARYTYHLFSSREEDDAVLFLYDERSNAVAQVEFPPESRPLPPARQADGRYLLYYRRPMLPTVVDMLRNEGPIYLVWTGGADTRLSTEYEPIGEGELRPERARRARAAAVGR